MLKRSGFLVALTLAGAAQAQAVAPGWQGRAGAPVAGEHNGRAVTFRPTYYDAAAFAAPSDVSQTQPAPSSGWRDDAPEPMRDDRTVRQDQDDRAMRGDDARAEPRGYAMQAYPQPYPVPYPVPVAVGRGWGGGWGGGWGSGWGGGFYGGPGFYGRPAFFGRPLYGRGFFGRGGFGRGYYARGYGRRAGCGGGALLGTIAGSAIGYGVADPWDRTSGVLIGGLLGAVTGVAIDSANCRRW